MEKQQPNKERIQMWVDALRSGEYKQCKNHLKNKSEEYCCLGVASEIYMKHAESPKDPFCEWGSLSPEVGVWFGLDKGNVHFKDGSNAIGMNDVEGSSFFEIADRIEDTFLKEETK